MSETFLNDRITLHCGDSRDVLRGIPDNTFDSIVTDPPYALTSIVKRFGSDGAAKAKEGKTGAYARASAGFMGQKWDTGEVAFDPAFWAECMRVLKPGGHVVAFGASRGYHRMACAIEDAGFEIRDSLMWMYGSGFPKSHDVSKGIDKRPGVARHAEFAADLRAAMASKGFTNTFDVAEKVIGRRTGAVANWQKYQFPQARWWPSLRDLLGMNEEKWGAIIAEAERIKTGTKSAGKLAVAPGQGHDRSAITRDVTVAATDAAVEWQGWGTALKPAFEPIVLARKHLSESTVAANVLRWGTGAINVDGCRIGHEKRFQKITNNNVFAVSGAGVEQEQFRKSEIEKEYTGRWPANILHDGSDEVVGAFPDTTSGSGNKNTANRDNGTTIGNGLGAGTGNGIGGDSGSAARFFYSAKADSDDRLGSKHPTVKPVDLMQWLVRLVTPKGGLVLDPFAGTGTTGEAAFREGMRCALIEREVSFQADIRRRMGLVLGGPEERRRAVLKEKARDKPQDHGPLFG